MWTPHHLLRRRIPEHPGHGQLLQVLTAFLISFIVPAVFDSKVTQAAPWIVVTRRQDKRDCFRAFQEAAALVPGGSDVILDIHHVPTGHLVRKVMEGVVMHLSDLRCGRGCCPRKPENHLDL